MNQNRIKKLKKKIRVLESNQTRALFSGTEPKAGDGAPLLCEEERPPDPELERELWPEREELRDGT